MVSTKYAGKISTDYPGETFDLVTLSQDVQAIKDNFGKSHKLDDFNGFFVEIQDGDYGRVLGFAGTVPFIGKDLYEVVS